MSNTSIYVACHKYIKKPFHRIYLKYIEVGGYSRSNHFYKINDSSGINISYKNSSYNELTALYWAWKNDNTSKIKGLCHYRRYFSNNGRFLLSNYHIKRVIKNTDMICIKIGPFDKSCRERIFTSDSALRPQDISLIREILEKNYGFKYAEALDKVLDRNWNYLLNMFIAKREMFNRYCDWLFEVLAKLEDAIIYDELVGQEKRIFGLWGEYLLSVFIEANQLSVYPTGFVFYNGRIPIFIRLLEKSHIFLERIINKVFKVFGFAKSKKHVLFRGPCDVSAIRRFIKKRDNITFESHLKIQNRDLWDVSNSVFLKHAALKQQITSPFIDQYYYPEQKVFDGYYDYIVFSILSDAILGVYRSKKSGDELCYGLWTSDATKNSGEDYFDSSIVHGGFSDISREQYQEFANNYDYVGRISVAECSDNWFLICSSIPKKTKIILLLGPTIKNEFGEENPAMINGGGEFFQELNKALKQKLSVFSNVTFVDPNDYIVKATNQKEMYYYNYNSINHYPLITYYEMACRIEKETGKAVKANRFELFLKRIYRHYRI